MASLIREKTRHYVEAGNMPGRILFTTILHCIIYQTCNKTVLTVIKSIKKTLIKAKALKINSPAGSLANK